MKTIRIWSTVALLATTLLTGCKKDNFDPPSTWMTGRLVHNGAPVYMDGSPSDANDEIIQFFQDGFGKHEGWGIRVKYDGTYSSLLFDGEYKLMPKMTITYPWEWTGWPQHTDDQGQTVLDTMVFTIRGNYVVPDIEITPYFEISDFKVTTDVTNINASFSVKALFPDDPDIELTDARLYVGPTRLVNSSTPITQSADEVSTERPIEISMPASKYIDGYINNFRDYCFARVAVKTSKSDRWLWSEILKVEELPTDLNDVSDQYLKNYQAPFAVAEGCPPADSYSTPADWVISDNCKINAASDPKTYPEMQGGLELRFGRNCIGAISFDTDPQAGIENGKIRQTTTLPAGKYLLSATPFDEFIKNYWGGHGTCYLVIAKGGEIPDKEALDSAIAYSDTYSDASVQFTLDSETEVTLGFLFNFPDSGPLACSFTKLSLIDLGTEGTEE